MICQLKERLRSVSTSINHGTKAISKKNIYVDLWVKIFGENERYL